MGHERRVQPGREVVGGGRSEWNGASLGCLDRTGITDPPGTRGWSGGAGPVVQPGWEATGGRQRGREDEGVGRRKRPGDRHAEGWRNALRRVLQSGRETAGGVQLRGVRERMGRREWPEDAL